MLILCIFRFFVIPQKEQRRRTQQKRESRPSMRVGKDSDIHAVVLQTDLVVGNKFLYTRRMFRRDGELPWVEPATLMRGR